MGKAWFGLAWVTTFIAVGQPAVAQAPRAVLPVRQVVLSDGMRRYTIPIRAGATAIDAGLDTGSTGLRILPGVLSDADAKPTGRGSSYSYGSGAKLDGVIGEVEVSMGEPPLSAVAPVELVRSVGCVDAKPHCLASRVALKDYGVQGDGLKGEGFKAIIGVNMADADVPNPLIRLGVQRWILDLPRPGDTAPGRLVLNPSAEETAGYTPFHILPAFRDLRGGLHDAIEGCLINDATKQKVCGPMMLDSGAPGLRIVTPDGGAPWPQGTPATIAFADGGQAKLALDITIGLRAHASNLTVEQRQDIPGPRLFVGLTPYFGYSVLYDPAQSLIGLKPRPGGIGPAR